MRTFRDREGREWVLSLTLGALKRIKGSARLDMLDLGQWSNQESNPFVRLSQDPITLADTLCAVCRPQMDERGISDEQFADALGGEAIDDALLALVEEWSDFFQQGRKPMESTLLRRTLDVLKETRRRMTQAAETMDQQLTTDRILSNSPTNSPESSESVQTDSHSAN